MASTITALTSSGGVAFAGDTTGALELKTNNGTTAVTIDTSQNVTLANPLSPASGGTGVSSITAENVVLGNGTGAVKVVAPGSNGNVLTSNGTTWVSQALPAGGVTSLNGQTGAITNTNYGSIGSYVIAAGVANTNYNAGDTTAGSNLNILRVSAGNNAGGLNQYHITSGASAGNPVFQGNGGNMSTLSLSGTWRSMTNGGVSATGFGTVAQMHLWVRIS